MKHNISSDDQIGVLIKPLTCTLSININNRVFRDPIYCIKKYLIFVHDSMNRVAKSLMKMFDLMGSWNLGVPLIAIVIGNRIVCYSVLCSVSSHRFDRSPSTLPDTTYSA